MRIIPDCPVVTPVGFDNTILPVSSKLKLFPVLKSNVVFASVVPSPTTLPAELPET